jgi:hypothetical protein
VKPEHLVYAVLGGALLGLAAVLCLASEVVRAVLLGWTAFLWNVLPRVSVDRPTLILAGVSFALFVLGIHGFGMAWSRRHEDEEVPAGRWRVRWSLATGVLVVVLFAAGISLVGIVHQTAWLAASSDKPWYGPVLRWQAGSVINLKEIGNGLHSYHSAYRSLPAGGTFTPEGEMLHSWETLALPFMFYTTAEVDLSSPWRSEKNAPTFRGIVPQFINPDFRPAEWRDGEGFGLSHYAANAHLMSANRGMKFEEITDGQSNTILAGEVNTAFRPWGHPENYRDPSDGISRTPKGFGGARSDGSVAFAMADGSVRLVTPRTSRRVLHALATPAGGESVPVGAEELEP